jgi:hypothetical protein
MKDSSRAGLRLLTGGGAPLASTGLNGPACHVKVARAARGVYEDPSPPDGYRRLRAIAADGTELVNLCVHRRAENRDPVPELREWLDAVDPQRPNLTLAGDLRTYHR